MVNTNHSTGYPQRMVRFCFAGIAGILLAACGASSRFNIPAKYTRDATMLDVEGARKRVMSFGHYKTSRISRGVQLSYPGWGKGFFFENLLLNQFGLQKDEIVAKEKDRFRYSVTDGSGSAEVFGKESEVTRSIRYKLLAKSNILNSYERVQQYQYIFSALIAMDTAGGSNVWNLLMSNVYDRRRDTVNGLFTIIKPNEEGLATNGIDTILIKVLETKEVESANGRSGKLPMAILAGYQLEIKGNPMAIIDVMSQRVGFFNNPDPRTKLLLAGITTAILARRVHDVKW